MRHPLVVGHHRHRFGASRDEPFLESGAGVGRLGEEHAALAAVRPALDWVSTKVEQVRAYIGVRVDVSASGSMVRNATIPIVMNGRFAMSTSPSDP